MTAFEVHPATAERWPDVTALFGSNGGLAGCWCMWFRQKATEFQSSAGPKNRDALRRLVRGDEPPGLLAYDDGTAVGWISLGPRERFGRIERSPTLKRVDDEPVWSIVCFFIHRARRGQGIASALLDGAIDYARDRGAAILEAYPYDLDATSRAVPPAELYVGTLDLFEKAGFAEVIRRSQARPIVRLSLGGSPISR